MVFPLYKQKVRVTTRPACEVVAQLLRSRGRAMVVIGAWSADGQGLVPVLTEDELIGGH